MERPETVQVVHNSGVNLPRPGRMSRQEIIDRNAWDANMRLIDGGEFPLTLRTHPTCHAADCAADQPRMIRRTTRSRVPARGCCSPSTVYGLWRSLVAHLTGGQGVASSNLASPTKPVDAIRPSRTGIQPRFLPPSITPSDRRSGPATDHQAENAVPASSMARTSGCR